VQNAALDFSKLQEAMVEGQTLSVSARAKLLESPFAKPTPTPSSVQKLAQQFTGMGIAPPKAPAQKTLEFGTPCKGKSKEKRVALGELHTNTLAVAGESLVRDISSSKSPSSDGEMVAATMDLLQTDSVEHVEETLEQQNAKDTVAETPHDETTASELKELEHDCAEMVSDITAAIVSIDTGDDSEQRRESSDSAVSSSSIPQLLGHGFDGYYEHGIDVVEEISPDVGVVTAVDDVEISLPIDMEISKEPARIDIATTKERNSAIAMKEQPTEIEKNTLEATGNLVNEINESEVELSINDCNSTVCTIPDADTEDAVYAAAVDESSETSQSTEQVLSALEEVAVVTAPTAPEEEAFEVGADARSQAVTVTEFSMQQQENIMEEAVETSHILESSIALSAAEQHHTDMLARDQSPIPQDPLLQASSVRMSIDSASKSRRNSSPMEDHLKLVVKSTIVGYCSEVQEENLILKGQIDKQAEKIDKLQHQIATTNKQLAITNSQLSAMATKEQINELQELLREAASARDQSSSSCRGCTIC